MNRYINNQFYLEELEKTISNIVNQSALYGKKIMVTGATGLIGTSIVDTLLKLNDLQDAKLEVYALGRSMERLEERFPNRDSAIHLIEQDVTENLVDFPDVDFLIHAASNANPKAYSEDPVGTIKGNVEATLKLLDYCKEAKVEQFIYISSGEVYGQLPEDAVPFTEDLSGYIDPLNVRSCYMLAKKLSENICVSYSHQYGLVTKIIRLSHVFGANYTVKDTRVSATFVTDALNGKNIVLKSLGNQLRSYVYISDAVSGILSVLTSGENNSAYNVTNTDNSVTLAEFAQEIARNASVEVNFEITGNVDPAKVTPISFAVLSDKKLRELNWAPQYSLDEGVKSMLDIIRKNQE